MRSNARPEAVERLNRTLAFGEIAKQESIAVEDAEVKARADEMMAEVDDPSQVDPERLNQVVNEDLLKEKILAWLKENSTVELVPEGSLAPAEDEVAEPAAADGGDGDAITVEAEAVEAEAVEAEAVVDSTVAAETAEPNVDEAPKADDKKETKKSSKKAPAKKKSTKKKKDD